MLDLRMLPLLPPGITVFAMETLTAEQTLHVAEVMPDLGILSPAKPCRGLSEGGCPYATGNRIPKGFSFC